MKFIGKTKSWFPLVAGIVGGILGIVSGLCNGGCGSFFDELYKQLDIESKAVNTGLLKFGGYAVVFASIAALVAGCIARSTKFGTLIHAALGVLTIVFAVLIGVARGGFPFLPLVAGILFIVGGLVGFLKIEGEKAVAAVPPAAPVE
ncbi:MAG: hypothetical protein FWE62_02750 [Firmicutes bacterium]|nr:hypothetical protein [Bacillota bacterium]